MLADCEPVLHRVKALVMDLHEFDPRCARRRACSSCSTRAGFSYAIDEFVPLTWREPRRRRGHAVSRQGDAMGDDRARMAAVTDRAERRLRAARQDGREHEHRREPARAPAARRVPLPRRADAQSSASRHAVSARRSPPDTQTTVEYTLPIENLHAVMRRVARAVPAGGGVYVAGDLLDLAVASAHDFGRAVVYILHGDVGVLLRPRGAARSDRPRVHRLLAADVRRAGRAAAAPRRHDLPPAVRHSAAAAQSRRPAAGSAARRSTADGSSSSRRASSISRRSIARCRRRA